MKEGFRVKHYASDVDVKTAVIKWLQEQNFTRQGYMLSFESETLLLRETVTMLRSRDGIHWGTASFWYKINILTSVIINVLKKKAFVFDSSSYNPVIVP